MGSGWVIEEMRDDGLTGARNERVTRLQKETEVKTAIYKSLLQLQQRYGIKPTHLAAETGGTDYERTRG